MCAMKHYFRYVCHKCICHFPFVVVEGKKSDWEGILAKLDIIEKYDLKFWVKELRPIITQIINAFDGNVDIEFWKNMLNVVESRGAYRPGRIDGWFTNFFLYDKYGSHVNGYISKKTELTSEILKIPFEVDFSGNHVNYEFLTGFFGVTQDEKKKSIKPVIGWAVRKLDDGETPEKVGLEMPKKGKNYNDDDDEDDDDDDDLKKNSLHLINKLSLYIALIFFVKCNLNNIVKLSLQLLSLLISNKIDNYMKQVQL